MRKWVVIIAVCLVPTLALGGDIPVGSARTAVGFNMPGNPITGEIHRFLLPWTISIPANYTAAGPAPTSRCSCRVAPSDGNYIITIKKNSTSEGTCTINTSATTGTFSSNATYTLAAGDALSIVAPTADSTIQDVSVTIGASQ